MARLSLALLGTPQVRVDGHAVSFPTRKAAALLIYLAVERGAHARERITALFWPESDEQRARGALRSTLLLLRGALRDAGIGSAEPIVAERDRLSLREEAAFECDLTVLDGAFALARGGSRLPSAELVMRLQAAVDSYRGDFLTGFSLVDAPEFEEWAATLRESCRRRMERVFDRLSRELFDGGDGTLAVEVTARWAALDPLNEAAHRRLMRLHFAAGDRTGALRAFEACRGVLAAELNADPAPATRELARRIGVALPPAGDGEALSAPPAHAGTVPLVGRLEEHAHLVASFRSARYGRPLAVAVDGEPGIGKTRLAAEFLRWATAQGATVLASRAYEAGGRLPYQPLAEALRAHLATVVDPRTLLGDVWLAELARLLPELSERCPDLPQPPVMGEAEARGRLFEALTRYLLAAAAGEPLVFLLDDVHWADTASLDALLYLVRRLVAAAAPATILLCTRSEELAASPVLVEWLATLGRELPLARLPLGPLGADDTVRLVRSLAAALVQGNDGSGYPFSELLAQRLHAETNGQPLFVTELMRALAEQGALYPAAPVELPPLPVPPGVRDLVRDRLARLSAPARSLVFATAVLGRAAFETFCRVAGLEDDAGLVALDELLPRRMLVQSDGRYALTHDTVRELCYAEAGEARRRLFHARAREALEAQRAPAAELAHHADAAGLAAMAFSHYLTAGDEAMRLFALREAIALYERARSLLAAATVGPPPAPAHDLVLRLARAYELTAEYTAARAVLNELLLSARATGDALVESAALNRLGDLAVTTDVDKEAALQFLEAAERAARLSGDPAAMVETQWNLARLGIYRSDPAAALTHIEEGLSLATRHDLQEPAARILNWLAIVETSTGRFLEAQQHALQAKEVYAALGDRVLEADSLTHLAGAAVRAGETAIAIEAARTALALSDAIDNSWGRGAATQHLALALLDRGEYGEALAVARRGVAAGRACGYAPVLLLNLAALGAVLRRLGAPDEAETVHAEAWTICARLSHGMFSELVAGELCADHAARGDWPQATHFAREARAVRDDAILFSGATRPAEVEALLRGGELEAATAEARRFEARVGERPRFRIYALRTSATLDAWLAGYDGALVRLKQAAALAERLALLGDLAEILATTAGVLIEAGEATRAGCVRDRLTHIVATLASSVPVDDGLRERFEGGWAPALESKPA
jgi:DNA-binding SARP family transcriptional activator/tetratricopeptide (TPR) repeat protein